MKTTSRHPVTHHPLRGALAAAVLVALSVLVVEWRDGVGAVDAPVAVAPVGERSYEVQPGDTLWAIARRLRPEGEVRPLVDRLAERRRGAPLKPGERIVLPLTE